MKIILTYGCQIICKIISGGPQGPAGAKGDKGDKGDTVVLTDDGNATTINGTQVDLGGTLNSNAAINGHHDINFGNVTPLANFKIRADDIQFLTASGGLAYEMDTTGKSKFTATVQINDGSAAVDSVFTSTDVDGIGTWKPINNIFVPTTFITSADFTTSTDCPLPSLIGKKLALFWNDVPKYLYKGVDWHDLPGGGFSIDILDFDGLNNPVNIVITQAAV